MGPLTSHGKQREDQTYALPVLSSSFT